MDAFKARVRKVAWLRQGYRRLRHGAQEFPSGRATSRREVAAESARGNLQDFLDAGRSWCFPSSDTPIVSVVIPVFNRAELTLQCLAALAAEASVGLEIIVIDNASSDETAALFRAVDGVRYVRNPRNLHFLDASNQGAALARGEFVLFLNSDTALVPGSLTAALSTFRARPGTGAVGGRLVLPDGTLQEAGSMVWQDGTCLGYGRGDNPSNAPYQFRREVDFCSAAFLLTSREAFERLDGFDADFRPAYYEEVDYCLRLWERGYTVVYEPGALVWHFEFASSTQDDATHLMREHQALLVKKHSDYLSKKALPAPSAILAGRSVRRLGQRCVLWIDERIPHAKYGAGYPRAREILRALSHLGCAVTMYPAVFQEADESWPQIYGSLPREIEVAALAGFGPEGLERFLTERQNYYDWIFISRPETMKAVRAIAVRQPAILPWEKVVYDAEALFSNRERLEAQVNGTPMTDAAYRTRLLSELALAQGVARITTVSAAEAAAFRAHGFDRVSIVSHAVAVKPPHHRFDQRSGILFVGAIHGDGGPNYDAVMWFCESVLPVLRRQGVHDTFYVVGYNRMTVGEALRGHGVEIVGEVRSLDEWYDRCRVFVAPTRFSAGIPLKVIEAVAAGIPAVITPLLARQLGWENGDPLPTCESADEFAAAVAALLSDEAHWRRTSLRSGAIVADRFSSAAMEEALREVTGELRPCHQ